MSELMVQQRTTPAQRFLSTRRFALAALCGLMIVATSGCGYMIGPAHDAELCTVAVPIFRNETFRRQLEYPLTEAVQKEIQKRTAMRIVHGSEAQTSESNGKTSGTDGSSLNRTSCWTPTRFRCSHRPTSPPKSATPWPQPPRTASNKPPNASST